MPRNLRIRTLTMSKLALLFPRNRAVDPDSNHTGVAYTLVPDNLMGKAAPYYDDPEHLAAWAAGYIACASQTVKAIEENN